MTHLLLKRPQAERDIEECFVYLAEGNFDLGVNFLLAVEESLSELSKFPLIGTTRKFHDQDLTRVRMWHVKGYEIFLIFYLPTETSVEVIRILHGARDITDQFS